MLTFDVNSKYCWTGNWVINLSVLLCYSNIIISESCEGLDTENNATKSKLPASWPSQWNNGVIPFAFDFFALSPKRLTSLVHKAHSYIEARSCLVFKEMNPVDCAREPGITYLFYTYSEVLESCCLRFFTKSVGRRLVLITPTCFLQVEVAHATLHGLGLEHRRTEPFVDVDTKAVLYPYNCPNIYSKLVRLEGVNL